MQQSASSPNQAAASLLTLEFTPHRSSVRDAIKRKGGNANVRLTLHTYKTISTVLEYLTNKWSIPADASLRLIYKERSWNAGNAQETLEELQRVVGGTRIQYNFATDAERRIIKAESQKSRKRDSPTRESSGSVNSSSTAVSNTNAAASATAVSKDKDREAETESPFKAHLDRLSPSRLGAASASLSSSLPLDSPAIPSTKSSPKQASADGKPPAKRARKAAAPKSKAAPLNHNNGNVSSSTAASLAAAYANINGSILPTSLSGSIHDEASAPFVPVPLVDENSFSAMLIAGHHSQNYSAKNTPLRLWPSTPLKFDMPSQSHSQLGPVMMMLPQQTSNSMLLMPIVNHNSLSLSLPAPIGFSTSLSGFE